MTRRAVFILALLLITAAPLYAFPCYECAGGPCIQHDCTWDVPWYDDYCDYRTGWTSCETIHEAGASSCNASGNVGWWRDESSCHAELVPNDLMPKPATMLASALRTAINGGQSRRAARMATLQQELLRRSLLACTVAARSRSR